MRFHLMIRLLTIVVSVAMVALVGAVRHGWHGNGSDTQQEPSL